MWVSSFAHFKRRTSLFWPEELKLLQGRKGRNRQPSRSPSIVCGGRHRWRSGDCLSGLISGSWIWTQTSKTSKPNEEQSPHWQMPQGQAIEQFVCPCSLHWLVCSRVKASPAKEKLPLSLGCCKFLCLQQQEMLLHENLTKIGKI